MREVLKAGASGYIIKRAVESELLGAIRAVHRGEIYVHPFMMRALLTPPVEEPAPKKERGGTTLTPREVEVLRFIARGYTYREAAAELHISVKTVETHVSAVLRKLQLSNRRELTRWAEDRRLV